MGMISELVTETKNTRHIFEMSLHLSPAQPSPARLSPAQLTVLPGLINYSLSSAAWAGFCSPHRRSSFAAPQFVGKKRNCDVFQPN